MTPVHALYLTPNALTVLRRRYLKRGPAGKPVTMDANGVWSLIAQKVYELYEQRGREDGYALDDWREAESVVMDELHEACE